MRTASLRISCRFDRWNLIIIDCLVLLLDTAGFLSPRTGSLYNLKIPQALKALTTVYLLLVLAGLACTKSPYTPILPPDPERDTTERIIVVDTLSYVHIDRNDLSPPSPEWLAVQHDTAWTDCGLTFFNHLRRFYPLAEDTIYGNNLYGLFNEPPVFTDALASSSRINGYFSTRIREGGQLLGGGCPQLRADTAFVHRYLGLPTHSVYNQFTKTTTHTYRIKSRWRRGPVRSSQYWMSRKTSATTANSSSIAGIFCDSPSMNPASLSRRSICNWALEDTTHSYRPYAFVLPL